MKIVMKSKIEFGRQGNFIVALLLLHFLFFGYLSNVYLRGIGEKVLFLYQAIFDPAAIFSGIILFGIVFLMVLREGFYEYGIRNSIWLIPFIIVMSWIWWWFINGFNILMIGMYFIRIETYINILVLLGINLLSAILAAITKESYARFSRRIKEIET